MADYEKYQFDPQASFLGRYQQAEERNRLLAQQQRQNALADIQLRAAQRGEEEALAEREAYKGAATLGDVQQRLMQAGLGKQSIALQNQAREQRASQMKQAEDEIKIGRSIAERAFSAGQAARAAAPGSEKQAILSLLQQYQGRGIDLSQDMAEIADLPDNLVLEHVFNRSQELKNLAEMVTTDTGEAIIRAPKLQAPFMAAQAPAAPVSPMAIPAMPAGIPGQTPPTRAAGINALALPPPGVGIMAQTPSVSGLPAGATRIQKSLTPAQREAEVREQQRIALEQRRVELAEKEAARKEAGLAEPISKQEIQKREARYPQAKSAISGFESESNNMIKKLQQLKQHKGLDGILGTVYGRAPSFTDESQAAQALYDQIMAKGKFQELQNMRLASPTGGALGNVSNMEIQALGQAFGALSRIQGKESFKAAIDDVIKQIESSKERTREAFDETYQYKQGKIAAPATPAAPTVGGAKFLGFE